MGLYVAVVFLGGGLLAPWLYWLVQAFGDSLAGLADKPFHRYVNRAMLILALAGMWPLLRAFGARSPREFGLVQAGLLGQPLLGEGLGLAALAQPQPEAGKDGITSRHDG